MENGPRVGSQHPTALWWSLCGFWLRDDPCTPWALPRSLLCGSPAEDA